jgi:hypothetical protein
MTSADWRSFIKRAQDAYYDPGASSDRTCFLIVRDANTTFPRGIVLLNHAT